MTRDRAFIAALTRGHIPNVDDARSPKIDRAVMGAVSRAVDQAGIRQSERYRLISDYRLKTLLTDGPGWQDLEGVFSLSRTPPANTRAGTVRYMDPFLPLRKHKRWDSAADRWSAAVTLYEMASGPASAPS